MEFGFVSFLILVKYGNYAYVMLYCKIDKQQIKE